MSVRKYKFNLCAHIARCEANYYRLVRLLRQPNQHDRKQLQSRSIGILGHQHELNFRVQAEGRFTSLIDLRQENPGDIPDLRMKIHVHHDLQTAEVISYQGHNRFKVVYTYPNPEMHLPNEKEVINKFFSELLRLCLKDGLPTETELADLGVASSH